jgi:hypothetical protein
VSSDSSVSKVTGYGGPISGADAVFLFFMIRQVAYFVLTLTLKTY